MITLTTEQAQQIEEALVFIPALMSDSKGVAGYHLNGEIADWDEFDEVNTVHQALTTIRAARAQDQAEQEPVAWMCWIDSDEEMNPANAQLTSYEPKAYAKRKPLCAAPQPVKQEPVAEIIGFERTNDIRGVKRIPRIKWNVPLWEDESPLQLGNLYAAPVSAKREWVELTDYEIVRLYAESPMCDSEMIAFARDVIAAFKEKNK